MRNYGHTHKALVIGAALAFALSGTALCPTTALAVTQETEAQLTETQKKLEDSAAAYDKATENVAKLQAQIDENNALIAELEAKLPEQQRKASQVMRDMYKYEKASNPFMSFILNSQSFDEFFTQMAYMNQIKDSNTSALEELNETQKQLEQTKVELEQAKAQADTEAKAASDALAEAQKLREAAQKKADEEAASELAALQQASSELAAGTELISGPARHVRCQLEHRRGQLCCRVVCTHRCLPCRLPSRRLRRDLCSRCLEIRCRPPLVPRDLQHRKLKGSLLLPRA